VTKSNDIVYMNKTMLIFKFVFRIVQPVPGTLIAVTERPACDERWIVFHQEPKPR
jgi:hypothetical protein